MVLPNMLPILSNLAVLRRLQPTLQPSSLLNILKARWPLFLSSLWAMLSVLQVCSDLELDLMTEHLLFRVAQGQLALAGRDGNLMPRSHCLQLCIHPINPACDSLSSPADRVLRHVLALSETLSFVDHALLPLAAREAVVTAQAALRQLTLSLSVDQ